MTNDSSEGKVPRRKAPRRRAPVPKGKAPRAGNGEAESTPPRRAPAKRPAAGRGTAAGAPKRAARPAAGQQGAERAAKPKQARPAQGKPAAGAKPGAKQSPAGKANPAARRAAAPPPKQQAARAAGDASPKAARPKPRPGAAETPRRAQAAAGKPAAKPGAKSAAKPAAGGGRRPGAAAGAKPGAAKARQGGALPKRVAPRQEFDEEPLGVEEQGFRVQKRSNAPVIIIVSVLAVVGVVVIAMMLGKSPDTDNTPEVAQEEPEESEYEKQAKRGKRDLDKTLRWIEDNPEKYADGISMLRSLRQRYAAHKDILDKAKSKADELDSDARAAASAEWDRIRTSLDRYHEKDEFDKAAALFAEVPDVLASFGGDEAQQEFITLRKEARRNQKVNRYLRELVGKALKYSEKGYVDIAKEILDCFPEKYEQDAALVWAIKERIVRQIQTDGIASVLKKEATIEAEAVAAREEKRRQEEELRQRLWDEKVGSTPWVNQLGRFNAYNWVVCSDRNFGVESRQSQPKWRLEKRGDDGVFVVDNDTGSELLAGVYTNFWKDYIVEFDVLVKEGTLLISPRTTAQQLGDWIRIGPQYQRSEPIDLGDDFPKSRWVTVKLEVRGQEVKMTRNDQPGKSQTFNGEDNYNLLSSGGFVFFVPDQAKVEIRRVRTKLVVHERLREF